MKKQREIAIEVIEEFEDLLDEKDITIPDSDRERKEEARIYGTTYYALEDKITEVIKKNYPKIIDEDLVRGIVREYHDILEGRFDYKFDEQEVIHAEKLLVRKLCDKEIEE